MLRKKSPDFCAHQQKIASCVDAFAPLPSVCMRVLSVVADSSTTAADLEAVLKGDISLVTSVLKLANSAFYGVRRQVDSLRHALLLLGKSEVQSLVLSRVMFQAFKVPAGGQKDVMVSIWRHSLECAFAAEIISVELDEESPVFFLGGMLHDIGKLVIIQKFLPEIGGFESYSELGDRDALAMELEALGCGHDEIGAMLLHRWMFPEELEDMLRQHHNYENISNCGRACQVLILANILCQWITEQDLQNQGEEVGSRVDDLQALLLRCGEETKIIPSVESLEEIGLSYRKDLEKKADILDMLSM